MTELTDVQEKGQEVPVVKITWLDHYSFGEGGWYEMSDLEDSMNSNGLEHMTVGHLVKETDSAYYVLSTVGVTGKGTQGFCILKSCVSDVQRYNETS